MRSERQITRRAAVALLAVGAVAGLGYAMRGAFGSPGPIIRLIDDGNEMMDWMIANVVSKEDANEQHFPRKEKPEFKIDGVTALLNALTRVVAVFGDPNKKKKFKPFVI